MAYGVASPYATSPYGASPPGGQNMFAQLMAMLNPQASPAQGAGTMSGITGAAAPGMAAGQPGNMNMYSQIMAMMQNPQGQAALAAPNMYGAGLPPGGGVTQQGPGMVPGQPPAMGLPTTNQTIPTPVTGSPFPQKTIGRPGMVAIPGG